MVVFDTSSVLLTIDPKAMPPIDPATEKPLVHAKERVDYLLKQLSEKKTRVLIPTPVLSEFLVGAGKNRHEFLKEFLATNNFIVGAFEERAAIEIAFLNDIDLNGGKKLSGLTSKAKVKFDRQVCAIAKVNNATMLYTDDKDLAALANANGIGATLTWELPLAPEDKQIQLGLDNPNETPRA